MAWGQSPEPMQNWKETLDFTELSYGIHMHNHAHTHTTYKLYKYFFYFNDVVGIAMFLS